MSAAPVKRIAIPCASTALPCGIEAILAMIWPPGGGYWRGYVRAGLCDPHARFQVQCAARVVIIDSLQVAQSEQLDVVLPEAPVRYRGSDRRDRQRLVGLIELEIQVRFVAEVGPGDQAEPLAFPGTGELTRGISACARTVASSMTYRVDRHVRCAGVIVPLSLPRLRLSGPPQAGVTLSRPQARARGASTSGLLPLSMETRIARRRRDRSFTEMLWADNCTIAAGSVAPALVGARLRMKGYRPVPAMSP